MKLLLKLISCILITIPVYAQKRQVHDAYEEKYGKPGLDKLSQWLDKMEVKPRNEYQFSMSMTVHVKSYKNEKLKDEQDMNYYVNVKEDLFAVKIQGEKKKEDEVFAIYDYPENAMIMLNMNDKTGFAMGLNGMMSAEQLAERGKPKTVKETGEYKTTCKKTGKTKSILGYTCEEYICIDEDKNTRAEMWVTSKIDFQLLRTGVKGPFQLYSSGIEGLSGMVMEASFYKYDKLESNMLVTRVNEKENYTLKSADYKISGLANMK